MSIRKDSRGLNDFFNTHVDVILEVNERMFKTLDVLRKTTSYRNSEEFEQYFDLCRVVDFTKIADVLHLITHFGVVSEEMMEQAKTPNEKQDLQQKRDQADKYLSYYNLIDFDEEMDKIYRRPIGLRNRSNWYSCASELLSGALSDAKIQINKLSDRLYFTNDKGLRQYINYFSVDSFAKFLRIVLHTSEIFDYQVDWTEDLLRKFVESLLTSSAFSTDLINNDIIQFNDCYLENGKFYEGNYSFIPRFYIEKSVFNVVKTRKVSKEIPEMNEFLLHLCDYDDDTIDVFLSRMSTFLLNDVQLKSNMSATVNVLYGASGENGKSLFLSVLQKIFDINDITSAGLRDFNNQSYQLPKMCQSLLVIDEDAFDLQLDSAAAANIKQFVHGQRMEVRSIYEKARAYRPRALVVACTNHMPTSVDKSDGFNRRFSIFTQTSKLVNRRFKRSEDWFATIKSEESAQYLLELLVLAHLDNMSRGALLASSARMKEVNEDFVEKNDTAVMFVRNVGLSEIIGKPVRDVRQKYEAWCEENGVTALKNKFNTTLESKFPLKSKLATRKDLTVDETKLTPGSRQIRAWVHFDPEIHQKYVDKYNANSEEIFNIDLTRKNDDVAKSIIEVLEKENAITDATHDEIKRKIEILMDAETSSRQTDMMSLVKKILQKRYNSEIVTVEQLNAKDFERYLAIAKGKKDLTAALKDPRRQVIIYRDKIENYPLESDRRDASTFSVKEDLCQYKNEKDQRSVEVVQNNEIVKEEQLDEETAKLSTNIALFIQDRLSEEEFDRIAVSEVKESFDLWCKENDIDTISSQKFNQTIETFFSRRRKNLSVSKMNISASKKEQYLSEGVRMVSCWVRN